MLGSIDNSAASFGGLDLASVRTDDARMVSRQRAFAKSLAVEGRLNGETTAHIEARDAAERLVAATFVEPLLAQMRESTNAAPPFAPTRAEKQLRALGDTMTAHSIVRAANMPLVERVADSLLARAAQGAE